MRRQYRMQLLAAMLGAALPLAAVAQGVGPTPGAPPAANGQQKGPRFDPQRMEKRMKLARTLGLAEALDLDTASALKLGDTMAKFDERRAAIRKQLKDSGDVLRKAAQGEKVAPADVDQAIQKSLDARAQMVALNREMVGAVTQGLTPDKKARAVIFLARFQRRFAGPHPGMMMPGHRSGRGGGPGMGPGGGMGGGMGPGGGWGMAPEDGGPMDGPMMGMAPPPPDDFDDE